MAGTDRQVLVLVLFLAALGSVGVTWLILSRITAPSTTVYAEPPVKPSVRFTLIAPPNASIQEDSPNGQTEEV